MYKLTYANPARYHTQEVTNVDRITENRVYFKDGSYHRLTNKNISYYQSKDLLIAALLSKLYNDMQKQAKLFDIYNMKYKELLDKIINNKFYTNHGELK